MSGWIILLMLAAAVAGGLWYWFRRDTGALQFLGAALLLAFAGYAWQGQPGRVGAPKEQVAGGQRQDSDFARMRRDIFPQFTQTGGWLTAAEALTRDGETQKAVNVLQTQVQNNPQDMVLWLGVADALLQHSNGMLSPAAEMAFNRAALIAPDHPAPRFFYALALIKLGQFEAADAFLDQVLAGPQVNDDWRTYVAQARQFSMRVQAQAGAGPQGSGAPPAR